MQKAQRDFEETKGRRKAMFEEAFTHIKDRIDGIYKVRCVCSWDLTFLLFKLPS